MTFRFDPRRRLFVQAMGGLLLVPNYAWSRTQILPFGLGVASGAPSSAGVVLWTRLVSGAPGDGLLDSERETVSWEIARDRTFTDVTQRGEVLAEREWAHSVHVEVENLDPDTWYWYRFRWGEQVSPVGKTRTLPERGAKPQRLRFVFTSCQHYETGYYVAHRHIADERPDLVIFLGDYIYESSFQRPLLRSHKPGAAVAKTLEDYRTRYALYKSDPDLQLSHAACPWLLSWDDHEVVNDYPGAHSMEELLPRRAAAYRAFWEHMPLPMRARPDGPTMRLYARYDYGDLARFHVLDGRQYRSPQAPWSDLRSELSPVLNATDRTMLGERQEIWLSEGLKSTHAQWNIVAQQTIVSASGFKLGPEYRVVADRWDGYPAARARFLEDLRSTSNPVIVGGDVHSFWAGEIKEELRNVRSPTFAAEFISSSASSYGPSAASVNRTLENNPHFLYGNGAWRGYVRVDVTRDGMETAFRAVYDVNDPASALFTLASFHTAMDRPGAVRRS